MNFRAALNILVLMFVLAGLCGCRLFAPVSEPMSQEALPKAYTLSEESRKTPHEDGWWNDFNSPELNALVQRALAENFSLQTAWARLRQSSALVKKAGADLAPSLSANADASISRRKSEVETETKSFSLGALASYEIDLWSRIRSGKEAARLERVASEEDVRAAAMTITAQVADVWIQIISQRMQKKLLERQVKTNNTYLELVEFRYKNAMASALDVYQQRQAAAEVQSLIPLAEMQERLLLNELALILGAHSGESLKMTSDKLPEVPAAPEAGVPADLMKARPDIRSAWALLEASQWKVAAARAARLPSITLSANAGYSSSELEDFFDNWAGSLAAGLVGPIIDGGSRKAEVEYRKALSDERIIKYREQVYTAIREVEDALFSESRQGLRLEALEKETDAARKALEEARQRYIKGLNDYLPVLTQLLSLHRLERGMIGEKADLLKYRIQLYRALGGTWTDGLKPGRQSAGEE